MKKSLLVCLLFTCLFFGACSDKDDKSASFSVSESTAEKNLPKTGASTSESLSEESFIFEVPAETEANEEGLALIQGKTVPDANVQVTGFFGDISTADENGDFTLEERNSGTTDTEIKVKATVGTQSKEAAVTIKPNAALVAKKAQEEASRAQESESRKLQREQEEASRDQHYAELEAQSIARKESISREFETSQSVEQQQTQQSESAETVTQPVQEEPQPNVVELPQTASQDGTVYVAPQSGTKYHRSSSCRGLRNANGVIEMSEQDAVNSNYSPCGFEH